MSNIILSNPRHGTRGEYLANYLLSGIGTVVQVPRQEDIGVDFHCSIGEKIEASEKFEEHFYIQLKSSTEALIYGNILKKNDKEKPLWKSYELDWLFTLQNPFFIGVCNSESQIVEIYSTSFMWHPYYMEKNMAQIKLLPNEPEAQDTPIHARAHQKIQNWSNTLACENKVIEVPLGPPIITITMDDLKKENKELLKRKNLLKNAVIDERRNINARQLKNPYFTWPYKISTNEKFTNGYFYATTALVTDEKDLLANATPMLLSLGLYYSQLTDKTNFNALKPLLNSLPKESIPQLIKNSLFD